MKDPYNLKRRGQRGYYVCDFILYGERVHRSTKKIAKPDAVDKCKEWADEIEARHNGKVPAKQMPIPTLGKALEDWEKAQGKSLSEKHVKVTIDKIKLHFTDYLETPLNLLDTSTVRAARATYLAKPGPTGRIHSKGGANSLIKSLKTIVGFFIEEKTLADRPFTLRRLPVKRIPRRVVPIQDTQAFLEAVDAPYKGSNAKHSPKAKPKNPHVLLAIRMMLALGLRENEALKSRAEWIDWENRTYHAGETKNGEVRLIPIPRWFMAALKAHLGTRRKGLIMATDDGRPHDAQFTKKVLYQVGRDLNLPGLTPHRLRATFATNHARAGTDIRKIQVWLDHAHIETTMLYIEMVEDGGHEAQDRVEQLMGFHPNPPESTQKSR